MKKLSSILMILGFITFGLIAAPAKMPVIKINSLNNKSEFATKPVSHSVKEHEKQWNGDSFKNFPDPFKEKSVITVIDANGKETLTEIPAKVKVRGNWTTSYEKKGLGISFDEKQSMLGLNNGHDFRNWVLLAEYKDASMVRDLVALKMAKAMFPEYYASDCVLVEVYINNEYWGVYTLAEKQEAKKNRINVSDPKKDYKGVDIGYVLELDMYVFAEEDVDRFWIDYRGDLKDINGVKATGLQNGYTIDSQHYRRNQRNFIQDYMNKLWTICYEAAYHKKYYRFKSDYNIEQYKPEGKTDDEKCRNCIANVIDIDSLVDTYILAELTCDPDLFITSFYMDIDFGPDGDKKLRFEAPWDFDSTMGNRPACDSAEGLFAGMVRNEELIRGQGNPWMLVFINCNWFKTLVKNKWKAVSKTGKTTAMNVIAGSEVYKTAFENNRDRWGNPTMHEGTNNELANESRVAAGTSQKASSDYLKKWLEKRFAELDKIFGSW